MSAGQKSFDFDVPPAAEPPRADSHRLTFTRPDQRRILRNVKLLDKSIVEGRRPVLVKEEQQWKLLQAIDERAGHNGWCKLSLKNLAREARMSLRTANRVLELLVAEGIVVRRARRTSKGHKALDLQIDFDQLYTRVPPHLLTDVFRQQSSPDATGSAPRAMRAELGATGTRPGAASGTRSAVRSALLSALEAQHADDADDADLVFLKEKANLFAKVLGGCPDEDLRERVLRVATLWRSKRIPPEVCRDVLRELKRIQRREVIKDPRALIFNLFKDRGFNLDTMIVSVPEQLIKPPTATAVPPEKGT